MRSEPLRSGPIGREPTRSRSMSSSNLYEDPDAASAAFGRRLREVRDRVGMSQDGLGRESDVHPTSIGRLERGKREPRLTTLLRLADGLGVEPGELVNKLE